MEPAPTSARDDPAQTISPSPNGASAAPAPSAVPPRPKPTPPLTAAAALAAIPPDIQITLAAGSSGSVPLFTDRGKSWVTSLIVLAAAGSDALFYPYAKYMVIYGLFVSLPAGAAIWRLWARRSVNA